MKYVAFAIASGLGLAGGLPVGTAAQDVDNFARDRNIAVTQRGRPELEALGLRWGSLMAYPKVQLDLGHDSNIFASETGESSDTFIRVAPRVDVESDWSRHALSAYARTALTRHAEFDNENNETWTVAANGRLDVERFTEITGGLEYSRLVEPRTSSNAPQSIAEPIDYDLVAVYVGGSHTVNRLRGTARFEVREFDYQDGRTNSGGLVEQDDRDQVTYEATGRVDYAISPATALFGRVIVNERNYDVASAFTPLRDSRGFNAIVGANFELSNLVRGEAGVGYLEQNFEDPSFGAFSGLSTNARLEYFATPLLTLGLTADRSVGDSGIVGSAAFLLTTVQGSADYELRRNILVNARVGYSEEYFDSIDRRNDRWFGGARVTYLMNRRIGLTASYDYESRDSSGLAAINNFSANRFLLSIVAQY